MVLRKILLGRTVLNIPKQFAEFVNMKQNLLFVPNPVPVTSPSDTKFLDIQDSLLEEPDHECTPLPDTIRTRKVVQTYSSHGVPCNGLFCLSNDEEPHFEHNGTVLFTVTEKMILMTIYAAFV